MHKIVAVGGTGQMVLHYYIQLYLLGIVKRPFEALIIDTDEILPSLSRSIQFLRLVEGTKTPKLTTQRLEASDATGFEQLTGIEPRQKAEGRPHPVEAFFDRESLDQSILHGLYARPALSSLMLDIDEEQFVVESGSTAVVLGSVTGGTGGGLIAPCIDSIRKVCQARDAEIQIRSLMFGEYFVPDPNLIGANRLQSNQLMVLRTARDAFDNLHSYIVIGGPGTKRVPRSVQTEKRFHVPWPSSPSHPFWEGLSALDHLLTDTVTPFREQFEARQIHTYEPAFTYEPAQRGLEERFPVAKVLTDKDVPNRIAKEPLLGRVWGRELPALLGHFWTIARTISGDASRDFPHLVRQSLRGIWYGETDGVGLEGVFPTTSARPSIKPNQFKMMTWPQLRMTGWDRRTYPTERAAADRAAATMLFWTLRGGD